MFLTFRGSDRNAKFFNLPDVAAWSLTVEAGIKENVMLVLRFAGSPDPIVLADSSGIQELFSHDISTDDVANA